MLDRSITNRLPVARLMCVAALWLSRHSLLSIMKFTIISHFFFVSLDSQMLLWLLISPRRMKSLGNCLSVLTTCSSWSYGEIYREYILTILSKAALAAVVCNSVLGLTLGYDIFLYGYSTIDPESRAVNMNVLLLVFNIIMFPGCE